MTGRQESLVLLVEDEEWDLKQAKRTLADYPAKSRDFDRAKDAIEYVRTNGEAGGLAMVLLDWRVAAGGGELVLRTVRQLDVLRFVPVVVFSRSDADVDRCAAYAGHANAYVVKPGDLYEYRLRLSRIFDLFIYTNTLPAARNEAAV